MLGSFDSLFLRDLFLTILIETIALFVIVRLLYKINKKTISTELLLFSGIITTGFTFPYFWFILPKVLFNYIVYVLVGEISIVLIEAVIYNFILKFGFKKALLVSFVCNLCSYLIGVLIS